jgi:hypothetical protein
MVSTFTVRAAVLVGIWAFIVRVKAQGYFYEDTRPYCVDKTFQYLGCFTAPGSQDPFGFVPGVPTDIAGSNDPSFSYVEYDNNDNYNATNNPYFCSRLCRHHGFKYTGMYNGGCTCASSLNDQVRTLGSRIAETNCANQCAGDLNENCGTSTAIRVWADLSFTKETDLTTSGTNTIQPSVILGYQKLGCFYGPGGGPNIPGPSYFRKTVSSADQCFSYCADLKLPIARVARDGATTYNVPSPEMS